MQLLQQGYGVQPPEWVVEEKEAAGYSRIYLLESGEVWYTDARRRVPLERGMLYIFPSQAPFTIRHNPARPICCLWCHLDLLPAVVTELIAVFPAAVPALPGVLGAFRAEVTAPRPDRAVLRALCEAMAALFDKEALLPRLPAEAARFLRFMEEPRHLGMTAEAVARHFGYTPEYFTRLFRRTVHLPPYQYLLHCRMNRALALLQEGWPVAQIGAHVGYADPKAFSRAFKARFGVPPSRWEAGRA